jgi:EAL domain-containing protein (putative c-di-GMP-specific phosphodiesterase class I)
VAEGVEDAAVAADLIAMGVTALQGYHFSRPMPARDVFDWIALWPRLAERFAEPEISPRVPAWPEP